MGDVDLEMRDPNNINDHLKVAFEDVLAEPEAAHSMECVWKLAYKCFNLWLGLCYKIATLLCGICIAMGWGCEFAGIAFAHIWFFTPCFRVLDINCQCAQKLYALYIHCIYDPYFEACSKVFDAFRK